MTPVLLAVAFLLSAAASTGTGGGGILTLLLVFFAGLSQFQAQGVNLFVFVSAAVPAALYHALKNGADLRIAVFLSFCGCAGSLIGSMFASGADQRFLRTVFGIFSICAGAGSLLSQAAAFKNK